MSPSFTKRLRKRPITTTIRSTPTTVAPTTLETEEFTTRKPTLGRIIRRRKFQRGNSTEEEAPIARGRGRVGFQKSTPQNSKGKFKITEIFKYIYYENVFPHIL